MAIMAALIVWDAKKQDKTITHLTNLALKVAELERTIGEVDESTGAEMNRLGAELREFRELYGDAAVEAERETARAEKAIADGVASIMSYGKQFQNRGE